MARVLSIEIGYLLTRVCELDFKSKAPKVYKSFTVPTLGGVMNDGVVEPDLHYVEGIRSALRENGVKTKKVVFSITSSKIATREVMIPFVKENRIAALVNANASDYFPVDLSQYKIAYSILDTIGDKKEGNQQYKMQVFAIPGHMLDGYYALAASLRLEVAGFDYGINSIYNVMKKDCATGTTLIAKIDERSVQVMVIKEQQIVFTRNVAYGVEEALQTVMESVAWGNIHSLRQTLKVTEQYLCIDLEDKGLPENRPVSPSLEEATQINVTEALMPMITGLARVIDYYVSRGGNEPIDKVMITGIGTNFTGMARLLQKEIEYQVAAVKKVEGMNLERYFKDGFFGEYLACIGAAMAPLGFATEDERSKKVSVEMLPDKANLMPLAIVICVGGIIIGGALGAVSIMGYNSAVNEQVRMNNRIAELEPVEKIYLDYLQQQYTHSKLTYFQNNTITPNEDLVAFIEEMEEKMPASLNVQSFSADLEGVTISLAVEHKDDAAWLVQQFRTFETVDTVGTSGITDTGAVMEGQVIDEEPMVTFTVTVKYKGSAAQAAIEAAEAEAAAAAAAATAEQTGAEE